MENAAKPDTLPLMLNGQPIAPPLPKPAAVEQEAKPLTYLPTPEDVAAGRSGKPVGAEIDEILYAAEAFAARHENDTEAKPRAKNQPTRSRVELRKELASMFRIPSAIRNDFFSAVNNTIAEMQKTGRVSQEAKDKLLLTLMEKMGVSVNDAIAFEQRFDTAMQKFAEKAGLEVDLKNRADERIRGERIAWKEQDAGLFPPALPR